MEDLLDLFWVSLTLSVYLCSITIALVIFFIVLRDTIKK
jgi:hypothetical protein